MGIPAWVPSAGAGRGKKLAWLKMMEQRSVDFSIQNERIGAILIGGYPLSIDVR